MAARAAYRPGRLMARLTFLNVKAPPATTSEAFGFIFQTAPRPQQKDAIDDSLYHGGARVNAR